MNDCLTNEGLDPMHVDGIRSLGVYAVTVCAVVHGWCVPIAVAQVDERLAANVAHFEQEIRPILVSKCVQCHGAAKQEGNLRLDSREALMRGGDSGASIVLERPNESLLIEAIKYESFEMPPSGQLPKESIKQFERWIASGATWPENSEPLREETGLITQADRQWWAFQPLQQPDVPISDDENWSSNPIDRFVYRRLAEHNMQPAPEASPETLVRRIYLDVLGLPPTPDELNAFLSDTSPSAWESLIDRLLEDERYGEHWARYWLDLVRYSESDGWNQDAYRPHIWRYRDYVVRSFNRDKPYPDFVKEQLAGDEIDDDNPEHLAAAGFLRLGIYEYNQRDARGHWNDIMNEMTDVAGDVFLGLSMACARCHDHKFDPIPQSDYFRLRAFFEPISWRDDLAFATESEKRAYAEQVARWEVATVDIRGRIDTLLRPYVEKKWASTVDKFPLDIQACFHMPVEERTSWQNQMAYLISRQYLEEGGGPLKSLSKEDKAAHEALEKELAAFDHLKPKPLPTLMTATDFPGIPAPTFIPDRSPRSTIPPGYLTVMSAPEHSQSEQTTFTNTQGTNTQRTAEPSQPFASTLHHTPLGTKENTSGRRTALAEWIGDSNNPLTTRVIVNRIWQQHFGQGIVATPSDFGTQGQPASHPELLDWLTATFIENGWSFKKLHKLILSSSTWKQSAEHPFASEYQRLDPAETLLWRARVRRLQAEQIRDAMLLASGELDTTVGGPSVDESKPRRSVYLKSFRNKNDTFLHGFDVANGLKSVSIRDSTTTPTQALLLINGDYAIGRAKKMAERLASKQLPAPEETLQLAFQLAWGRTPSDGELNSALNFVHAQSGEEQQDLDADQLIDFCHVLFNSNQFLYVE